MKSIAVLLLLGQSAEAVKLQRGFRSLVQLNSSLNPEVSDIMEFADDKEYISSQMNMVAEVNMHDTTKYSMSSAQFNSLMQKEKEKEQREHEDQLARENLKKLEQEIENTRYQQLVEMVQGKDQKAEADKKAKEDAEQKKKKEEEQKKQEEEKKKKEEKEKQEKLKKEKEEEEKKKAAKLNEEKKKKELEEQQAKEQFNPVTKEAAQKIDQMHTLIAKFERSQNLDDYAEVKKIHTELRKEYKLKPEDMQTKFDMVSLFKQGFNEFPQIAHNDFTIDQLNFVYAEEDNLNANAENEALAANLVQIVKDVSNKLHAEYADYWKNPFVNAAQADEQKKDEEKKEEKKEEN